MQQVEPQVQELNPTADVPGNSGTNSQNLTRASQRFEPTTLADSPFLFGSGGQGADNGIRGWGEALNRLGLGGGEQPSGGGEQPSGGDPEGAE